MLTEETKYYVTTYALTDGVKEYEGSINGSGVLCTIKPYKHYFHNPHFHSTIEEANKRAEEMRIKKIKSLEKSIEKLKSKSFI